jgi:hypothetical protein
MTVPDDRFAERHRLKIVINEVVITTCCVIGSAVLIIFEKCVSALSFS